MPCIIMLYNDHCCWTLAFDQLLVIVELIPACTSTAVLVKLVVTCPVGAIVGWKLSCTSTAVLVKLVVNTLLMHCFCTRVIGTTTMYVL